VRTNIDAKKAQATVSRITTAKASAVTVGTYKMPGKNYRF